MGNETIARPGIERQNRAKRRVPAPLTLISLIVSVVGVVDAALGSVWDHFVMFGVLVAVQLLAVVSAPSNRVAVTLRPDLARWALRRAQRTGQPVDDVIDRSVAWFQHGLAGPTSADDD